MGHCIEAFVAAEAPLRAGLEAFRYARVIPLRRGLALAPVTDELQDEVGESVAPDHFLRHNPAFWRLSPSLARLGREISRTMPVAYIETDYFGGVGTQAAIAWDRGIVVFGPEKLEEGVRISLEARPINRALRTLGVLVVHGRPIHRALRALGVRPWWPVDAFDALGLGRFRSNEDWIEGEGDRGAWTRG